MADRQTAVRKTFAAFLRRYAEEPKAACDAYLLPRARAQIERTPGFGCRPGSGPGVVDPYRLRLGFQGTSRVRVRYAITNAQSLCGSGSNRIPERRDVLVKTDDSWKFERFGFGRIRCVKKSRRR